MPFQLVADVASEVRSKAPLLRYLRNGLELVELTGMGVSGMGGKHGGQWASLEASWVMFTPVLLLLRNGGSIKLTRVRLVNLSRGASVMHNDF